ncbi:MAG: enoyl-CoA hydratase-related protein [Actinomycetota bacterium]
MELALDTLHLTVDDAGLARLVIDRPEAANALDRQMSADIRTIAVALDSSRAARAVLVTANGPIFCGGGDLRGFAESDDTFTLVSEMTIDLHAAIARLAKLDAPVVAAVSGAAGGAGMSLVAALDLVVAGESAKFTMGYTKAGLVPDGSSSFFLARSVGYKRALDLALTNRVLSAAEAEEWGLVARVVPDGDVETEAEALATQLAAGPTRTFGLAKRLILAGANSALEEAMERESVSIAAATRTADAAEGIEAFLAKRRPEFRGE